MMFKFILKKLRLGKTLSANINSWDFFCIVQGEIMKKTCTTTIYLASVS